MWDWLLGPLPPWAYVVAVVLAAKWCVDALKWKAEAWQLVLAALFFVRALSYEEQAVPQRSTALPDALKRAGEAHATAPVAVLVLTDDGRRGSGVCVDVAGRVCVVTAAHVVQGSRGGLVVWGRNTYPMLGVLATHPWADLALLACQWPENGGELPPVLALSQQTARPGDVLWIAGYGNDCRYSTARGSLQRYATISRLWDQIIIKGAAAEKGQSGGPILDSEGRLLSVLWAKLDDATMGTAPNVFRQWIASFAEVQSEQHAVAAGSVSAAEHSRNEARFAGIERDEPQGRIVPDNWTPQEIRLLILQVLIDMANESGLRSPSTGVGYWGGDAPSSRAGVKRRPNTRRAHGNRNSGPFNGDQSFLALQKSLTEFLSRSQSRFSTPPSTCPTLEGFQTRRRSRDGGQSRSAWGLPDLEKLLREPLRVGPHFRYGTNSSRWPVFEPSRTHRRPASKRSF